MEQAIIGLLQHDYASYVEATNAGWIPTRFHRFLCKRVQEFIERKTENAYSILIVQSPPQHGKSETVTETLPSWFLGRWPRKSVIEVSYSEDFAQKFGLRNKQKIKEFGAYVFGVSLSEDKSTATEFWMENNKGGMISRGVSSGVTGNRANLLIIDDPVKTQQEADSETMREHLWDEWNSSYKTRLAPDAKVILIMTRWHEDDLAGRIIANEKNVEVLNFPCEAEKDDLLGRKVGEALCPEIGKDDKWLRDFKAGYATQNGLRSWNALFQGHPVSQEGNLLKREWWQYYDKRPEMVDWVMSVDAAFKDGDDNDFVAIQVWGKREAQIYLIDAVKKHLDMPGTVQEILRLRAMYPECKRILIEDKANGSAVIQTLRRKIYGVIPINPEGGKVSRVNAVSGAIESGNVYLPKDKHFTYDFVEECASFPKGKHDDQVDAMSQALNRLIYWHAEPPVEKVVDALTAAFPAFKKKTVGSVIGRGEAINVI